VVFRTQIKAALEGVPGIEVAGTANNGKIALQKLTQSSVDLITLDMEMPEMSGLETIREVKKAKFPVKIIVFSSHTTRGSEAALEALTAGAHDFVAKPSGADLTHENAAQKIREELLPKVKQFVPSETVQRPVDKSPTSTGPTKTTDFTKRDLTTFQPSVLVVGSSTGGPPALEKIFTQLSLPLRVPVLIAQHMPPLFTASLAKRLSEHSGIHAAEGVDGEKVLPNRIYVAPGDFHMTCVKRGMDTVIKLDKNPQRNSVRPAVDPLFESAAEIYGSRTFGVILTGMGEDGLLGCKAIKKAGGGVMIQDQVSSVVWGMPGAVHSGGCFDGMGNLSVINELIKGNCG
jgi:two-component system chemotaxis response regulator CheB